jgi:hypothetical protein
MIKTKICDDRLKIRLCVCKFESVNKKTTTRSFFLRLKNSF